MNRDDIIRLAREAATEDGSVNRSDGKNIVIYAAKTSLFLERFAALVATAEREACAKVCDDRVVAYRYATDSWAQEHIDEARHLAAAIRSRGT